MRKIVIPDVKESSSLNRRIVILNLFQDNTPPLFVILKQVQDDVGLYFSPRYQTRK